MIFILLIKVFNFYIQFWLLWNFFILVQYWHITRPVFKNIIYHIEIANTYNNKMNSILKNAFTVIKSVKNENNKEETSWRHETLV